MYSSKQSAGGKATAIILRKKSIENYYKNPNFCLHCKEIINVGNQKVGYVRRKKFCNKKCAASYNNKIKIRNKKEPTMICKFCSKLTKTKSKTCMTCYSLKNSVANKTKGELFSFRKNWQSASSSIRKDARKIFEKSENPKKCFICGYDKHYHVSHKKPVSEFKNESKVYEINKIDNLVALCPNHHWELDNGYLKL